ncbi:ras family-domain-containing [Paramuricea clavata]|uniref:Ras family-domain-containing n=1 Tax=Paramuricea clavata TaxID=317549 RepID=A0A7D9HC56_PARCT|nr:ras family-domain-containing [Paramuricea clavata]
MAENQDAVELQTIKGPVAHYKRPIRSYKVSFAGMYGVGKTSLLRRILKEGFSDIKPPSSVGIVRRIDTRKHEEILHEHETVIPFVFWDTADMERYDLYDEIVPYSCHRGSHFILLVYSAVDEESFYELLRIAEDLERYGRVPPAKVILVRNKIDLPIGEDGVLEEKEKEFLRRMNLKENFLANFWTSAKTNEGVKDLLRELGKHSLKMFESRRESEDHNVRLDIDANKQENQGFSCSLG